MSKLKLWKRACGAFLLWAMAAAVLPAQSFITLHRFDADGTQGARPAATLIRATDGNFYGTTSSDGPNLGGTVFKMTPNGALTTLYAFCSHGGSNCTDGDSPSAGLVQGIDGDLYGTTYDGGANNFCYAGFGVGCGTVFKITTSGALTTLYSFCSQGGYNCTDGYNPLAGLIQAKGDLYGTTYSGGAHGAGTIFKLNAGGTLTTLYNFCSQSNCTDGYGSNGDLVQATDGNFYGTTLSGGANDTCGRGFSCGTVFKITPSGTLTTLHSFDGTDGGGPSGGLVQATDGNFYGVTQIGGATALNEGTVFKITPSGTVTTLYSFCPVGGVCPDGVGPYGPLIQATDGNLYGTTERGGAYGAACSTGGCGTVFSVTPTGTLTTLHTFCSHANCGDGSYPFAGLVQDTDGKFYGITWAGGPSGLCTGPSGCGVVFGLSVGLAPFVETLPASGTVGAHVKILGTNLTGATSVTFNGTAATFTVHSRGGITTTVPVGATTGTVQVVTPGGTLSSNVPFTVN